MSDIKSWSNTAGSNNSAPPNGAPEGMAPSAMNDTMREMMASIRRDYEGREFRDWGHTPTYASTTTFTIPTDVTAIYHANRRLKATVAAGIVYATIQSASYASPNTTITVKCDSGSLDSGLSSVAVGPAITGQATGAKGVAFARPDGTVSSVQDELSKIYTTLATVTGNKTFTVSDFGVLQNITATATLTLPAANTVAAGTKITLKSTTTGKVILNNTGSDTIDGISGGFRIPSYDTFELVSDGASNYLITRRGNRNVGDIVSGSSSNQWVGYLKCDGSAVSRSTYANLYDLIGTTYGTGDGSTTFNLPDYRGRALVGAGQGTNLTNRNLGDTGGEETHKLTVSEMPSHTHNFTAGSNNGAQGSGVNPVGGSLTETTAATGGDGAHNNMQPFAVAQFLIKT